MKNKPKIHINKINTEIGKVPVLSNFQRPNYSINVHYASRIVVRSDNKRYHESIFFILREKDANQLQKIGYNIESIIVPANKSVRYCNKLEIALF